MATSRAALLEARLAELKAELARKDAAIAALSRPAKTAAPPMAATAPEPDAIVKNNNNGRNETAKSNADAPESRIAALRVMQPDLVDSPASLYPNLLDVLRPAASEISHVCNKLMVTAKLFPSGSWERNDILGELVGSLTRFCAIAQAAASCQVISSLRQLIVRRGQGVVQASRILVESLDGASAPVLCGVVEDTCKAVEALPVSSKAATKRSLLELAAMIVDSHKEFSDLLASVGNDSEEGNHNGKEEDWADEDDDLQGDELDEDDKIRLSCALEALIKTKQLIMFLGNSLPSEESSLEGWADAIASVSRTATNFAAELYPPQESKSIVNNASDLMESMRALCKLSPRAQEIAVPLDELARLVRQVV